MLYAHVHAVWTRKAALTWTWSMDINMQHGHYMQYCCGHAAWLCHVHAARPYLCSMDMDMQHEHGHAAWMDMDTQHVLGHAGWTWACSMDIETHHVLVNAACIGTCSMDMAIHHCTCPYCTLHTTRMIPQLQGQLCLIGATFRALGKNLKQFEFI
jgi:hypothetical protein